MNGTVTCHSTVQNAEDQLREHYVSLVHLISAILSQSQQNCCDVADYPDYRLTFSFNINKVTGTNVSTTATAILWNSWHHKWNTYMRWTATYKRLDYKNYLQIIKKLNTRPITEFKENYTSDWKYHTIWMLRSRFPFQILSYQPKGQRLLWKHSKCWHETRRSH